MFDTNFRSMRKVKDTYAKGARYERKAKRILEKAGYLVIRSAASKGPFDIVAIKKNDVRLIQVKVNALPSPEEEETLILLSSKFVPFSVECWIFRERCSVPEIKTYP